MPIGISVSLEGGCDSTIAGAEDKLGELMNSDRKEQFFTLSPLDLVVWVASGFLSV